MASTPSIANFDANAVRAGLRLAMQVGLPVVTSDQPTFFLPTVITGDDEHSLDSQGTPYDPDYEPTRTTPAAKKVPCAVDYQDQAGVLGAGGVINTASVVLTLLDEDYAKVKGFAYVVIGGIRYNYQETEKPTGLVSVGVWVVHCLADDV